MRPGAYEGRAVATAEAEEAIASSVLNDVRQMRQTFSRFELPEPSLEAVTTMQEKEILELRLSVLHSERITPKLFFEGGSVPSHDSADHFTYLLYSTSAITGMRVHRL